MQIIQNRKKFFILSLLVIIIGFGFMIANAQAGKGALNWDVEFTGGTSMELNMNGKYDNDKLISIIKDVTDQSSPQIQEVLGTNNVEIKLQSIDSPTRTALVEAIQKEYSKATLTEANDISGTVSGEMQRAAIKATLIAAVAMLIYISIRFKDVRAGGSAILALIHDVLVVLAAYAIFRIPVNNAFIAVLLTILGYSVNSTIVIFDRIRENKGAFKRNQTAERINKSIHHVDFIGRFHLVYLNTDVIFLDYCIYQGFTHDFIIKTSDIALDKECLKEFCRVFQFACTLSNRHKWKARVRFQRFDNLRYHHGIVAKEDYIKLIIFYILTKPSVHFLWID